MSKKTDTPAKPTLHKVEVQRDHTHNGALVKAGDNIEVTAPERRWLIAHGVVVDDPAPAAQTPAETESTGGAQ